MRPPAAQCSGDIARKLGAVPLGELMASAIISGRTSLSRMGFVRLELHGGGWLAWPLDQLMSAELRASVHAKPNQ